MGRLSDFHPQPIDGGDDPNEGEAASARSWPDPIGIPAAQRRSARRRDAVELLIANSQRACCSPFFVKCNRAYRPAPHPLAPAEHRKSDGKIAVIAAVMARPPTKRKLNQG